MSRFVTKTTPIEGVVGVRRKPLADERGFLERLFCREDFAAVYGDRPVAQINRTLTRQKGTVRGMHFQHPPFADAKLVSCLRGRVFDVAVDLRRGSSTFLSWHSEILGPEDALFIPEGCAHGLQTLEPDCELIYLHGRSYAPDAEGGVNAADPRIRIEWPLPIAFRSARDEGHSMLDPSYRGIAP